MRKTIHSRMGDLVRRKIVEIRSRAGFTQRDLAKKLGREHSFVARIEQGERRVDIVELYLICKACKASPEKMILNLLGKFKR
ncbi:MAG: helix-turn-helix transcriptional regulator [Deltaproteobacteria bacterium]|nr:helix-turn-helix transcriptional regulator [Deltaproteobacteria bacterium]